MQPRDAEEEHRAATWLELFFDLCFVVAVAQAAASLHHALAADEIRMALVNYPTVFFAIWWAWMNFTWFSSAYDTYDTVYLLATFVQIAGVLILAAGVPRAFDDRDFGVVTLGYLVMRVALVAQWLRASRSDPPRRATDRHYAFGIGVCMIGWILLLVIPTGLRTVGFLLMVVAELSVPIWAERAEGTTWHPHHIAERFGLFTLIVLGETVLAATVAVQTALDSGAASGQLVGVALGGLLIVFSMWWLYFSQRTSDVTHRVRARFEEDKRASSFIWGYGHFFVFAAAAAVGAGLATVVDADTSLALLSERGAATAVAVPVAVFVVVVWLLHRDTDRFTTGQDLAHPIAAFAVVVLAVSGVPVWSLGLVLVALVAFTTVGRPAPTG